MFKKIFDDVGIELIVSGITLLLAFIWTKVIFPIIENIFYKGIRITGTWSVQQTNPTALGRTLSIERETIIKIKQKTNKIKGEASSTHTKADKKKDIIYYKISGEVRDRFVTIFFKTIDKNKIAHSAFLVEHVATDRMKGYRVFYGSIKGEIDSISCLLCKVSE